MLPDVQIPDYQSTYNSLGSVYDPQTQQVQSQIADIPSQEQTTLSSLDQAKVNAFRDITNSANAKGVLFSGFTPDQQAQYVGTKYLPAVAATKTASTNARNTLLDKINQINAQRSNEAQGIVSSATKTAQDTAYKNAQLGLGYARLASSNAKSATQLPSAAQVRSGINQGLSSVRGRDGYVAPQDYALALKDWLAAGLSRPDFNKQFKNFRNPNNTYYDYAIKQAGL